MGATPPAVSANSARARTARSVFISPRASYFGGPGAGPYSVLSVFRRERFSDRTFDRLFYARARRIVPKAGEIRAKVRFSPRRTHENRAAAGRPCSLSILSGEGESSTQLGRKADEVR